jgi:TPR repeat protein
MDNADDAYVDGVGPAQCFACGQLFCGQCKPQLEANVPNCPNCRASLNVSADENVARLLRLLERTPGRHTPHAQFNLGVTYDTGRGVRQDYFEAVKWYRLASDQGDADAQFNLGGKYREGKGVLQDYVEAVKWYRLAADQGNAIAQSNLGMMYEKGEGVSQDYVEAVKWYTLAADQGHAKAQSNLGVMYEKGKGVRQDHVEAVKWYRLAADQGHAIAQTDLGAAYANGAGVPQDFTKAVHLFKLAADQGHADAITNLPILLHQALFPSGTKVKLAGLKATMLNGLCGVVVQHGAPAAGRGGRRAAAPPPPPPALALGKVAVLLDTGREQAFPYENLLLLNPHPLFPPGTKVKLAGLKAAALNGKRGVVVARSGAAAPALGRIAVELEGGGGIKALPYEKLERI